MTLRSEARKSALNPEYAKLVEQIVALRAEIQALTDQRDRTAELRALEEEVEERKRQIAALKEQHDRETREIKHKVGLLKKQQEQDAEHQVRQIELKTQEAKIEVREENLAADKQRFAEQMEFQRAQLQGEIERVATILDSLMERLPVIEVNLEGTPATRPPARSSRKEPSAKEA